MSAQSQALASLIMAYSRMEICDSNEQGRKECGEIAKHSTNYHKTPENTTECTVKIYVGPGRELFVMNQESLIKESPFFEACLKPNFREGYRNQIDFPEDDPSLFNTVKLWIDTSHLPDDLLLLTGFDLLEYLDLYALADKLMMYNLQNIIVDIIRFQMLAAWATPTMADLISIDECHLLDSSELGRFLTESLVFSLFSDSKATIDICTLMVGAQLPAPRILLHVLDRINAYQRKSWDEPRELAGCRYHIHSCKIQQADCKKNTLGEELDLMTVSKTRPARAQLCSMLLEAATRRVKPPPSRYLTIFDWFRRWSW